MTDLWPTFLVLIALNATLGWRLLRHPKFAIIYISVWWIAVQSAIALLGWGLGTSDGIALVLQ